MIRFHPSQQPIQILLILCSIAASLLAAGPAAASAYIQFGPEINVSNTTVPSTKGRLEVAVDPMTLEKIYLVAYGDGPAGAADIFLRYSSDGGATFSAPINLSNTAGQINTVGAPGDSFKPDVKVNGGNVQVAWVDTYCPGGAQGSYTPPGGVLTAFHCLYIARSFDAGRTWEPAEQITDGSQDAFNISSFSSSAGFATAWQEDPLGLQPGEGQGPGDGGSGALTSPGTDIYYTALGTADFESSTPFPAPTEVSDNLSTSMGSPAASRAQLRLVGNTALLAYEETRGMMQMGKNILYHSFPFTAPPSSAAGDVLNESPTENCRRVRLISQSPAATGDADTTVVALWRQGAQNQGGPADILMRRAVGAFGIGAYDPAINLTSPNLDDPTGAIPEDNARAHRALLRGDFVAFVYNYTPDDDASQMQLATYDTYIRRSQDGGQSWDGPVNLSNLNDFSLLTGEPRLVGTPPTIPSGDPQDVRNVSAFFVSWGTHTNDGANTPLDLFVLGTQDGGESFGPIAALAVGPSEQGEAQLRSNPAGSLLCATWSDDVTGDHDIFFRCATATLAPPIPTLGGIGLALLVLALTAAALKLLAARSPASPR
ncbi:MAG: sialidase family protein [Acidobacteriota bacterium]|nr:sialidase family protein [Acidobacteriota bacterium]